MMAGLAVSGALLLVVVLIDGSFSYPMKQGFEPGSYGGGYGNPSAGKYIPAASGSGMTSKMYSKSAPASYSSNSFMAPARPDGPAKPVSPRPGPLKEFNWAHPPPSPFTDGESPATTSQKIVSSAPSGPSFQGGELAHVEENYEHGNFESETEEQGVRSSSAVKASAGPDLRNDPTYPGNYYFPYPSYDVAFLTGLNPPGTVSFSTSSFEHGTDHWQDHHYVRQYPAYPNTQQKLAFTADFEGPQIFEQASQPVYQSFDGPGFDQSAAPDAAGLYGSHN